MLSLKDLLPVEWGQILVWYLENTEDLLRLLTWGLYYWNELSEIRVISLFLGLNHFKNSYIQQIWIDLQATCHIWQLFLVHKNISNKTESSRIWNVIFTAFFASFLCDTSLICTVVLINVLEHYTRNPVELYFTTTWIIK